MILKKTCGNLRELRVRKKCGHSVLYCGKRNIHDLQKNKGVLYDKLWKIRICMLRSESISAIFENDSTELSLIFGSYSRKYNYKLSEGFVTAIESVY